MINSVLKHVIRLLPQNAISRTAGKWGHSSLSRHIIKPYSALYKIDKEEIEKPLEEYPTFTAFFTRKLKEDARPISSGIDTLVSPVDGKVAQFGTITEGALIQAKGINYTVEQLLGCTSEISDKYEGGTFLTIYLSPSDYHRIHMPLPGKLTKATYLPGRLFPVNRIGVEHVQGLFTKNERLITYADTPAGEMALVKVGAFVVGSVRVPYGEHSTNVKNGRAYSTELPDVPFEKGEEVGLFEFGSTVVLLFEKDHIFLSDKIQPDAHLKYGEAIGTFR
ncbi:MULTISPECIES: archaetidylserine decarboxylase [Fictibacillus]|uniref:Phosphatidylserine decarboxylase proenzyme n=1 Tax=Fictibacillus enclensis TaxID=1017270 RepID=A0A0V8J2C8_9BACL|nr:MULTISPECIES: archaetidylserine decarboxylase [Fictibacillus]KSU81212.1 phosphatidylserine decarboxylase [Fictibacillus enclensis]RXZ00741.1 phosphatidylserine decarboxylase [Fictibacillus sp. S7]SCC36223.1 phosphatidylserine decarboxylase [Fictibacillus enclensis]